MNIHGFKVGDRVVVNESAHSYWCVSLGLRIGDEGVVTFLDGSYMGVEFDKNVDGHSCQGRGRLGHCLWLSPHSEIYSPSALTVINSDSLKITESFIDTFY